MGRLIVGGIRGGLDGAKSVMTVGICPHPAAQITVATAVSRLVAAFGVDAFLVSVVDVEEDALGWRDTIGEENSSFNMEGFSWLIRWRDGDAAGQFCRRILCATPFAGRLWS